MITQDFDRDILQKTGNGIYTPMDPQLIPPLHLIYAKNPSDSGKARDFTYVSCINVVFLVKSLEMQT